MLRATSDITGYGVRASDGAVGSIDDLLFDDRSWTVRWVVVDTGGWLGGRKVLLPPSVFAKPDSWAEEIPVELTRERVESSPEISADAPVSRQMESSLYDFYGGAPYWVAPWGLTPLYYGPGAAGLGAAVGPAGRPLPGEGTVLETSYEAERQQPAGDPNLRSVDEVTGYYIRARDGDIGHAEDFLVDDDRWAIHFMVVDTKNWWPGRKVMVPTAEIRDVSWADREIGVGPTRDAIKRGPEYDRAALRDHAYDERLRRHYGPSPSGAPPHDT